MIRALLALIFLIVNLTSSAHSFEGEYVKPSPNCFSSAIGWLCEAPLEEGIAIKHRTGNHYYLYAKTRSVNGHFCKFTSIARLSNGHLEAKERGCSVTVSFPTLGEAMLTSEGPSCQTYCGARASLYADHLVHKPKRKSRPQPVLR